MGHSLTASLDYASDIDTFTFLAAEGIKYRIFVGMGTLEDAWIELNGRFQYYDLIESANPHENGQSADILWQSPYTDMVFVSVSGEGGTGDYTFSVNTVDLYDDHPNARGKGTAFAVDEETTGELELYGDVDAFRLDAEEGTVYEITVDLWTLEEAPLNVEDIHGNLVVCAGAYQGRNRGRASAAWKAEMTGFYYVFVHGDSTGTYSLSGKAWQDDHGDSSETATALQVGEYVKSRIDTERDIDYFVFHAEEGASYLIESELGDLAFISLSLLDRRGEIASDDNHRDDQPARIEWEAPAAGEYWVAFKGRDSGCEGSTGTYGIMVKLMAQPER